MITLRQSGERGRGNLDWVESYLTFSFLGYRDPRYTGFRALRVMNEDRIAPGRGFGPHAHRDMEIITYVMSGALLHRDSMGEKGRIGPNEIQVMSAGTGVVHSEFNASEVEPVHLMQIWIEPATEDLPPSYQQIAFSPGEKRGRLRLLAAPETLPGPPAAVIRQDVRLYAAALAPGEAVHYELGSGRHAWVQLVHGEATLNDGPLEAGDGAAISDEPELSIAGRGREGAEILLFDLP